MNTQEMTLRERRKALLERATDMRLAKIMDNRRKVAEMWGLDPSEVLLPKEVAEITKTSKYGASLKANSWGVRTHKIGRNIFYHAPDVREMVAEEERILSEYQQAQREQEERAHQAELQGRETQEVEED